MKKLLYLMTLFVVSLMIFTTANAQVRPGQSVFMGSYEQDNNTGNGKESIEWIVLEVSGKRALLLSRYALDAQPYNNSYVGVTWESCSLRYWLNNDFYYSAFNSGERDMIALTNVSNPDNPVYGTTGGNNTLDKVFLLSIPEVKYYFREGPQLECLATKYTKARGKANDYSIKDHNSDIWWWWLRTPGSQTQYGATVNVNGGVVNIGYHVDDSYVGIRPAMWIYY